MPTNDMLDGMLPTTYLPYTSPTFPHEKVREITSSRTDFYYQIFFDAFIYFARQ
jgi:hypothetical protein